MNMSSFLIRWKQFDFQRICDPSNSNNFDIFYRPNFMSSSVAAAAAAAEARRDMGTNETSNLKHETET